MRRLERKLTAQEVAARAGISRALLHRIERGDLKTSIGAAFEVATIVGVTLFEPTSLRLATRRAEIEDRLILLPKSARAPGKAVKDDF